MASRRLVGVTLAIVALLPQACGEAPGCAGRATAQRAGELDQAAVKRARAAAEAPAEWRLKTYRVSKSMLGRAVTPFDIYVDVAAMSRAVPGGAQVSLKVLIQRGDRGNVSSSPLLRQTQMRPDLSFWQLRGEDGKVTQAWLVGFVEDRDGTYHTIVQLGLADLKRSYLVMFFQDADPRYTGDENLTLELDMTDYDWPLIGVRQWVDQASGVPSVWE